MAGGIYLLQDGGGLVEMAETAYDTEALLQELVTSYPSLLAGDRPNADLARAAAHRLSGPGTDTADSRSRLRLNGRGR